MIILHLALGGCLKSPPTEFGITADTGGHIAYVLDAALHQARQPNVDKVIIATRLFEDDRLGLAYAQPQELVAPRVVIQRIAGADRRYLEKEALGDDLAAFTAAFCEHLAQSSSRPDIIHAHFADAASVAMAAQRRFGIPFVYTPHALGKNKASRQVASNGLAARIQAERAAIVGASAVVVSTQDEALRQVGAYGVALGTRIHVIAPGVPRADLAPRTPTLADELGAWLHQPTLPIILAIARPVAKKNLVACVRAYRDHPALREAANLVILAGQHDHASDHERSVLDELNTLAADPALRGRVALPPQHDAGDVAALYALAAKGGVFVNPALHEPFGLTLIEAANAGVPVVATRNGGPAEIVETIGHGVLVDPQDDNAIARAIFSIVADANNHAAFAAAALTGTGRYCWRRYAVATLELYRKLAQPRLLACDIDHTLTGCYDAAAAFAAWRTRSSFPFVVATGRSFHDARSELRRWHLPQPDAFIVDVGTRLMIPDGRGGWRECEKYSRELDSNWDRTKVVAAIAGLAITPQPETTAGPHKVSFFGSAADADRIRATLAAADLPARVIFSHGRLIDVLAPAGGKAAAIAAYAARLNWTLADCVAIGDSGNDADMLAACGHAIIVANASQELAYLPERPGLHRTSSSHGRGVIEGLKALGLYAGNDEVSAATPAALRVAAAA